MHIPTLFPDELIDGQFGRFTALNAIDGRPAAVKTLRAAYGNPQDHWRPPTVTSLMARALGLDPTLVTRDHSLIPVQRLVTHGPYRQRHGDQYFCHRERVAESAALRAGAYMCPDCIEEDLGFWGVSYWRRSHQFAGVSWCMKHEVPLWIDPCPNATLRQPALARKKEGYRPIDPPRQTQVHEITPALHRYAAVYSGFLDHSESLSKNEMADRIRLCAEQRGLQIDRRASGPFLSDLVVDTLPQHWWRKHLDSNRRKSPGYFFTAVDSLAVKGPASWTAAGYAAVLASLFESADDALTEWFRPSAIKRPDPPPRATASSENRLQQMALLRTHRGDDRLGCGSNLTTSRDPAQSDLRTSPFSLDHH